MSVSVLVAYSTIYGSTQEVAAYIAEELRKNGFEVDVKPAREVQSLDGYDAVVLGAPLYMFRWLNDAHRFLARHHKALETLPIAIFALGPFHNKEDELQSASATLEKELAKYAWLKPVATEVFVGKFDPAQLRFPYSLIGPLKKMPASDERNWEAISAWSQGLFSSVAGKDA
ncbi:MAG TPA: flavodoxin domain-containing protein [Longilinea sp.]|nr:flavodoxin domain-containing protein [Longilinea sp.]